MAVDMDFTGIKVAFWFFTALLTASVSSRASAGTIPMGGLAEPRQIFIGQPMRPETEGQWAEAEGVVTFVGQQGAGINLELSSGEGHMPVAVAKAGDDLVELLLKSRIRAEGICVGVHSSVNGETVSSLSVPTLNDIFILQLPQETWQRYPLQTVAGVTEARGRDPAVKIMHLRGEFQGTNLDGTFTMVDVTGTLKVRSIQPLSPATGTKIEILGTIERKGTNTIFLSAVSRELGEGEGRTSAMPILTTTEQVRWLKPGEAERRYPVRVRAVVTFLLATADGAVGNLQDGTGGIYAWHLVSSDPSIQVHSGDFCEIQGDTSAGEFSPGIYCHRLKVLGRGQFPEPVRPGWNELIGGSLDAQWAEVEGIVLGATDQHLEIGMQGGHVSCFVSGATNLEHFLNAVVRVRGVVVADWDQSRHVQGVHFNLPSEEFISLETLPLKNPFSLPVRQIKELLYYYPGESPFRQEKVTGEIIGIRNGIDYLTDGTNGLRLNLKENDQLAVGDMVEAVGVPELDDSTGTPLITLREAVVRVTGQHALPTPEKVAPADLLNSKHDSTRVELEAQLVHFGTYGNDQILELQDGARTFFARLNTSAGTISELPIGSRVEVAGVYVFNNGKSNGQMQAGPFELLLNSPKDIQVLEMPSWWTSEHALMVVSGMGVVILFGLIWIGMLRQQVGRRTAQLSTANHSLEAEIAERKRMENELVQTRLQHLMERERTRIARDIHDELGSSLSQIRLLSEMTLSRGEALPESLPNAEKISAKALEATHVLDEIVWAVDPQNDTLESLLSYLFSFASEYLSLAGIRFRIDAPTQIPHHPLTTQIRHQLYMAFKELLTNIANHAHATEVRISLRLKGSLAHFTVEDNGCGFDLDAGAGEFPGASGLKNMSGRFKEIGGDFTLKSSPGKGTRVEFILPLMEDKK